MDVVAQPSPRKSAGELANVLTKRRSLVDNAIGAKNESDNEASTPMRSADALNGSDNSDATPSPEFLRSEKPKADKKGDTPVGAKRSLTQRLSGAGFDVQLSPEQHELKRLNEEEAARLQAPEEERESLTRTRTESFRQAFEEEPPEEREKREVLRTESFRKASEEFEAVDEASRLFFEEEGDQEEEFARQRAKSAEEELLRIQAQAAEHDRRALALKEEAAKLEAQELMTRIVTAKEAQVREMLTAKYEKEVREAVEADNQRNAQEQEAARIKAADDEAARQKAEEEDKRRKAQEQEAARKQALETEAARQKAEDEKNERQAQEQEAARIKAADDEAARQKAEEEDARKEALETEAARQKADDEKKRRQAQEQEAARTRAVEDEAARQKAEQKENSFASMATTTSGAVPCASQASSTVAARPAPSPSARTSSSLKSCQKVEVRTLEKKLFKEGKKDVRQYTFEVAIRETQKLIVAGRYSDLRSRCLPVFGGFPSNHAFGDYTRNEDNVAKRAEEIRSFFEKKLNAADNAAMQTMLKTLTTFALAK